MRHLFLAFALITATPALAERGPSHERGPSVERLIEHANELELSDDQIAQLRAIEDNTRDASRELHDRGRPIGEELRAELESDAPDKKKVEKLVRELGSIRVEGDVLRTMTMIDVREVLTPLQREKIKAMRAERGERGEHGERGGHKRRH